MSTFREFVNKRHATGQGLLQHLDTMFKNIDTYDNAVDQFLQELTREHAPVSHAYKKYKDSLGVLRHTIMTAIQKDRANPERGDHPPVTISDDPRGD